MLEDYNKVPRSIARQMPLSFKIFPALENISIIICLISLAWLLLQGAWQIIFYGICALILFQPFIGLILLPETFLSSRARIIGGEDKKRNVFFETLSLTYLWFSLGFWSFLVIIRMFYSAGSIAPTSIYLWAYSASVLPIIVMIRRDKNSALSGITNIFLFLNVALLLIALTNDWGAVLSWEDFLIVFAGLLPFLVLASYRYNKRIIKLQNEYFE